MKFNIFPKLTLAAAAFAGACALSSCSDDDFDGMKYWQNNAQEEEQESEVLPKNRYIWIDLNANFERFANSKDNIAEDLAKAKDAGFTHIVVDVRGTEGDVIFNTSTSGVKQVTEVVTWGSMGYGTYSRTETWDYLQAFIDEGHRLGLKVYGAMNTFAGARGGRGMLFRDADKRDWATTLNTASGLQNVMDVASEETKFFNPANPKVQDFLCSLISDLAKYDVDGIILDRGRYHDLTSDFSTETQKQFEAYIGVKGLKYPTDVLPVGASELPSNFATYTTRWLEFRAKVIYDFMAKARQAVKSVNSKTKFGVYVGAWYSSYYTVGVNWAAQDYDPSKDYRWASVKYKNFGYAASMDVILLGAYANPSNIYGAGEWSVQGFCLKGKNKIGNACPEVVGGPDVGNWTETGLSEAQIAEAVTNTVDAAMSACDGYFLFDMCHLRIDPYKWDAVKAGLDKYLEPFLATDAEEAK